MSTATSKPQITRVPRCEAVQLHRHWLAMRGLDGPPLACYPPEAVVAWVGGKAAGMAWEARVTGAQYAYIENLAAPTGQSQAVSRAALCAVIDAIEKACQRDGINLLFVSTPHPSLARCIERAGFTTDSSANIHLFKHLTT